MSRINSYLSVLRWAPIAIWSAITIVLMWTPDIPTPPTPFGDLTDKIAHYVIFALQTVLLAWAVMRLRAAQDATRLAMLTVMGFSLVTELGQAFVPGRNVALLDLAANWLGVLSAGWVMMRINQIRSSRGQQPDRT